MTQFNKHTVSILLMCSSIALLLVFQYFWLRKVYEEQRIWLQKEAEGLFQTSIMELQDSMFQSKILLKDSCSNPVDLQMLEDTFPPKRRFSKDQASTIIFQNDSGKMQYFRQEPFQYRERESLRSPENLQIMLATADSNSYYRHLAGKENLRFSSRFPLSPDSIRSIQINKTLQQVVLNVQQMNGDKSFVIRIGNDSMPINAINHKFTQKLHIASIPITFDIIKLKLPESLPPKQQLVVGPVPAGMSPRDLFAAQLSNYDGYLFSKTIPQLLFSLFLLSITSLAFWLVYRSLRQQERLTALKNDFISNITHELKTPIATVSVAIEALNNFNALQNPQLTKEYLDISKMELDRLTILVDKVLKMSIFEQKELELRLEAVDLKDLTQQITASMRLQFEKYQADVKFHSSGEDFTLEGDRLHLTSVIYNLLDNALKYSSEAPQINIDLEQQNGHLNLFVHDSGIGIAPEYRSRVFEKFFRVPTGDVHNVKGYGLGLNYVSSVVQKHGGKIEVESEPGRGSCFKVVLPRKN